MSEETRPERVKAKVRYNNETKSYTVVTDVGVSAVGDTVKSVMKNLQIKLKERFYS